MKLSKVDIFAILFCFTGAVFSGTAFMLEYNHILVKLNEDPVGSITFKKGTAQRKFSDRGIWDRLRQASPLYNGDRIRTIEHSEAVIVFEDEETYLNLDENTMIQLFFDKQRKTRIDFSGGNLELFSENKNLEIVSGTSVINIEGQAVMNKNEEGFIFSVLDGKGIYDGNEIETGSIIGIDPDGELFTGPIIAISSFGPTARVIGLPGELVPVVFSWNVSNFNTDTSVIIDIAADKEFKQIVETSNTTGITSVSIQLENGNYWWRAFPASAGSLEPANRLYPSGTLEVIPAVAAVLLSPSCNSELTFSGESRIPFSWSVVENASAYILEISVNTDMYHPFIYRLVEGNSIIQTGLDDGRWYWRITPVYQPRIRGSGLPSAPGIFSVSHSRAVLTAPVLTFPPQNGETYPDSSGIRLFWTYDPNASSWLVELADNSDMINPVVMRTTANNFLHISPGLLQTGNTWYWRVTVQGNFPEETDSAVSSVQSFEVISGTSPLPVKPIIPDYSALPFQNVKTEPVPVFQPIYFGPNVENFNDPVYFDEARRVSRIQGQSSPAEIETVLSQIVMTLYTHGKYRVMIEGHTNPTINPADIAGRLEEQAHSLQPLSEIRARTVFNELVKLGIDPNRLEYSGLGGERPAAAWEDSGNWWMNRRVEFIIIE